MCVSVCHATLLISFHNGNEINSNNKMERKKEKRLSVETKTQLRIIEEKEKSH